MFLRMFSELGHSDVLLVSPESVSWTSVLYGFNLSPKLCRTYTFCSVVKSCTISLFTDSCTFILKYVKQLENIQHFKWNGTFKHRMLFHAYSRILSDNALHRAAVSPFQGSQKRGARSTFVDLSVGWYTVKILSMRTTTASIARSRTTCEKCILIFHR